MADLQDALVAQQQVGRLQITMEDPVVMEMSDPSEQLNHQSLHFACGTQSCRELTG